MFVILVCGEALVDSVKNADGTMRLTPGGGPFNTARALARLGVPTAFLGHLSNDGLGKKLGELLVAEGASLALATVGQEPTTLAIADVDGAGLAAYEFVVEGTSAPNLTPAMIPDPFPSDITALHVGTLGLVLEPMASTLTDLILSEGAMRLVMLDPNIRPALAAGNPEYRDRLAHLMRESTIVKASETDLSWLKPGVEYAVAADEILDAGARLVVVTLGAQGAYATARDLQVSVEAPAVEVVDTIGAGDAFSAAFLAWLHDHDRIQADFSLQPGELRAALEFACLAASLTCARAGAEPPTLAEMEQAAAARR